MCVTGGNKTVTKAGSSDANELWELKNKKEAKLEEDKERQAVEAEVDEEDGAFTNISLADDTGT